MNNQPTDHFDDVDATIDVVPQRVPFEVVSAQPEPVVDPESSDEATLGDMIEPVAIVETQVLPAEAESVDSRAVESEAVEVEPVATELVEVQDVQTEAANPPAIEVEQIAVVDQVAIEPPQGNHDLNNQQSVEPQEVVEAKVEVGDAQIAATMLAGVEFANELDQHQVDDPADTKLAQALAEEAAILPFAEMGLAPAVLEAIKGAGYTTPSPIQLQTVPSIMEGNDLIGQAETGSGKTAAFAWPILSRLNLNAAKPQCMILAPTRELAIQVTTAFRKYGQDLKNFRTTTIYGGQNYETQFRALQRGAHVVVGTPGRVIDHLNRGTLDLSDLKFFILDEADEMLRMGFVDDIEQVLERTPGTQQTLFFSATMPPQIRRIAERYLTDPVHVKIESDTATADSIEQTCIFVEPREKLQRLVRFLETEETDGVLIFVKTRNSTNIVSENLIQNGFITSSLNGDIPQHQRERTVAQLKSGKINVVVATDVAARGLDVSRISHVINYDFPHDTESYVHRIGRTGRAGRKGNAVLFVEPKEKGKLSRLQRATNQRIDTFKQKSIGEINDVRVAKFKQQIVDATEHKDMKFYRSLVDDLQRESELPVESIAAALAVVAQGETPLLLEALKSPKSNWKKDREKKGRGDRGPMKTYRVEVGRSDGVGPGNLVGAITNEANLTNADIGRIKLFDRFSTIDLPADLPEDLVQHLRNVYVSGRPLQMTPSTEQYEDTRGDRRGGGGGARGRFQGGRGRDNSRGRDGADRGGYRGRSNDRGPRSDRHDRGPRGPRDDRGARGERSDRGSFRSSSPDRSDRGNRNDRGDRQERGSRESRPYAKGGRDGGRPSSYSGNNRGNDRANHRGASRDDRNSSSTSSRPSSTWRANDGRANGGRASDERSPRGEDRPRRDHSKQDERPRSNDSRGVQNPKRKKTKAALRTQARKKPGATLSSPIKKYVKIRSAKKK